MYFDQFDKLNTAIYQKRTILSNYKGAVFHSRQFQTTQYFVDSVDVTGVWLESFVTLFTII